MEIYEFFSHLEFFSVKLNTQNSENLCFKIRIMARKYFFFRKGRVTKKLNLDIRLVPRFEIFQFDQVVASEFKPELDKL